MIEQAGMQAIIDQSHKRQNIPSIARTSKVAPPVRRTLSMSLSHLKHHSAGAQELHRNYRLVLDSHRAGRILLA